MQSTLMAVISLQMSHVVNFNSYDRPTGEPFDHCSNLQVKYIVSFDGYDRPAGESFGQL